MQFFPTSCSFMLPRSRYSPHQPDLKHPQHMNLPYYQRPGFTPIQNYRQIYSFVYFNF
jgi:hypothetical protein